MIKLKIYLIFLSVFCRVSLNSQDTVAIKIIDFPTVIRSMANDENGNIFIESVKGLYQFNGSKYWLIDPNYNKGTLFFYRGKLTNQSEFTKKSIDFFGDWQKNAVWHPFIPGSTPNLISHAIDKNGQQFLASNNQIFKVVCRSKFIILQKGYSTRGISFINKDLYINTYRGIFRNKNKILPHVIFAEDLFYEKMDSSILFSTNSNLIKYYPHNGESEVIDLSYLGKNNYINKIIEYKGNLFLGSWKGFIDFKNRKYIGKNVEINDLIIIDDKVFISSSRGVYIYDGKTFQKSPLFQDEPINSIDKIGSNYWLSTKTGLYVYFSNKSAYEKVLLDKDFLNLECYTVKKDKNGFYWASTAAGLYRFQKINDVIECYFPSVEFNKRSFLNHNDIFYFGSVQGVITFNPSDFKEYLKVKISPLTWIYFGIVFMIVFIVVYILYKRNYKTNIPRKESNHIILENEQDKFLFDLGSYILENLVSVSVEDLIVFSQMNKKAFYRYMDFHFSILPSTLIQTIKELKARSLIRENPGIQLEMVAKNVGYSLSHLFLVLREKEPEIMDKLYVLNHLKY